MTSRHATNARSRPGWYRVGRGRERFWSGRSWTRETRRARRAKAEPRPWVEVLVVLLVVGLFVGAGFLLLAR